MKNNDYFLQIIIWAVILLLIFTTSYTVYSLGLLIHFIPWIIGFIMGIFTCYVILRFVKYY